MGIHVNESVCDGCGTEPEPACVRDCPGDLMFLGPHGKAAIVDNRECWDCAACLKGCPAQAISLQLTGSLLAHDVSLKARALPERTVWSIRLCDGEEKTYQTPATGHPPFAPNL